MPPFGSPGAFPSNATIGQSWTHYRKSEPDFDAITSENEFEDGGRSFLLRNDTPPERWHLIWRGLEPSQADVITTHYRDAAKVFTFTFTDKAGAAQTNVRYEDYKRTHAGKEHLSQWQTVEVVLVKLP
jgi:hypothetical protein